MNNTLILITGMPATGKSTFASWLSSELCVPLVSYDNIKRKTLEIADNHEKRDAFVAVPYEFLLFTVEEIMKSSSPVIADYIFSDHMRDVLDMLTEKYAYKTISVHMDADIEPAYHRFTERSNSESAINGIRPSEISFERFAKGVKQNKDFRYGDNIIIVNTTDFHSVSYENIVSQIRQAERKG